MGQILSFLPGTALSYSMSDFSAKYQSCKHVIPNGVKLERLHLLSHVINQHPMVTETESM